MKSRSGFSPLALLLAVLLCVCLQVSLTGCVTVSGEDRALIQVALDAVLPPDFTGATRVGYKTITIEATGLRRESDGWRWDSVTYRREGGLTLTLASNKR